jgi:hypothetical protein
MQPLVVHCADNLSQAVTKLGEKVAIVMIELNHEVLFCALDWKYLSYKDHGLGFYLPLGQIETRQINNIPVFIRSLDALKLVKRELAALSCDADISLTFVP